MPTRWHMMSEKQLSILTQGINYARGNRQIIRIPRAFACISAGAPWLWRNVMQIDKVSQEPARLRMLTAPFHRTFFPLEVHNVQIIAQPNTFKIKKVCHRLNSSLYMKGCFEPVRPGAFCSKTKITNCERTEILLPQSSGKHFLRLLV